MFDILDLKRGQISEVEAVLLAAGSLFHPESSLMEGELMSRAHQGIRQPISDSTDSLSVTEQTARSKKIIKQGESSWKNSAEIIKLS